MAILKPGKDPQFAASFSLI